MIISARHKCPNCGRTWSMPVNTSSPDWQEQERAMIELLSNLVEIPFRINSGSVRRSRHLVDLATL